MKFNVKFTAMQGDAVILDSSIGLKMLDEARYWCAQHGGCGSTIQNVALCRYRGDINLELAETMARESGLYISSMQITVYVESGALNRWASYDYTSPDGVTAYAEMVYCKDDILAAWRNAGYPKKWDVENKSLTGETS